MPTHPIVEIVSEMPVGHQKFSSVFIIAFLFLMSQEKWISYCILAKEW